MKKILLKFRKFLLPALLIAIMLGANDVFAQTIPDSFESALQKWGQALALIGSLINVALWVVIGFISDLLNSEFIYGEMEPMLLSIWQTVRNFVNIAFVFVLLVIAFYNIVSIDPDKIPLKKSLGKVAIALILVNFSYFGAKVVLDVANVMTTAVFAIPRDIIQETELNSSDSNLNAMQAQCHKRIKITEDMKEDIFELDGESNIVTVNGVKYGLLKTNCIIPNVVKVKLFEKGDLTEGGDTVNVDFKQMQVELFYEAIPGDSSSRINIEDKYKEVKSGALTVDDFNKEFAAATLTEDKFGRDTITMVLAKTMFDLNKLTEVSSASGTFLGLTISGIVNLVLLLLYGAMFIAMFLVLLLRIVYLWICIAFSPVVALLFVFKDFGIESSKFDLQKIFFQYAFVPVKMGIALSVGVLMLFKANQVSVYSSTVESVDSVDIGFEIPIDAIINDTSLQKLMWNIATIAVMWIAIKWSMEDLPSDPITGFKDKVFGYVENLGGLAAKAPLMLPISPFAEFGGKDGKPPPTLGELFYSASAGNLRHQQQKRIYRGRGKNGDQLLQELKGIDPAKDLDKFRQFIRDNLQDLDKSETPQSRLQFINHLEKAGLTIDSRDKAELVSMAQKPGNMSSILSKFNDSNYQTFEDRLGMSFTEMQSELNRGKTKLAPLGKKGNQSLVETIHSKKQSDPSSFAHLADDKEATALDEIDQVEEKLPNNIKKQVQVVVNDDNQYDLEATAKMMNALQTALPNEGSFTSKEEKDAAIAGVANSSYKPALEKILKDIKVNEQPNGSTSPPTTTS